MKRSRSLIVAVGVGVAAVSGVYAATSTISLGSEAKASTNDQVAQQTAQLDRFESSLQKTLAQQPPTLPAVPSTTATSTGAQSATPSKVVYRRAASVVVGQQTGSHDDDEYEHEDRYESDHNESDHDEDGSESDD